jgi:hypothetical protein
MASVVVELLCKIMVSLQKLFRLQVRSARVTRLVICRPIVVHVSSIRNGIALFASVVGIGKTTAGRPTAAGSKAGDGRILVGGDFVTVQRHLVQFLVARLFVQARMMVFLLSVVIV